MAVARRDNPLPSRSVVRETVQDQVYRQLVAMILDGEIEPCRTVTIAGLAEVFGVSAMPVREALHRLTAAKVLTVIAGRSVRVPPLTVERLSDLARVRAEVEGLAAAWAAREATVATLARLDTLIAQMSGHLAAGHAHLRRSGGMPLPSPAARPGVPQACRAS